ncbi:ATP-binding cassette domain-containing protein [Microbacterium keratanolyticum]|uniref:ATP-binding cassette domain-containing protein n=1 Tax=Microbacterium keratanolyticum TaxID=67574 RepID=UPI00364056E2
MKPTIDVRGLRKQFGTNVVLDGLDLQVFAGEIFALLGTNGAGKTTTINILTTLVRPDGGSAHVLGHDVVRSPLEVKRRISLTGQSAAVDNGLSGLENLTMFARLAGLGSRESRERADELLAEFGLSDAGRRRVGTYSGGMRRRLDLALSFVVQPEVLFLDEPTTGLDTRSRRDLWEVIRSLAAGGTTVFLTTQYLEEADHLADRIAVLANGRIAALGTPSELKALVGTDSLEVHDAAGTVAQSIPVDGSLASLRDALRLVDADETAAVSLRHTTLDDVFLALTADTSNSSHGALDHSLKESA